MIAGNPPEPQDRCWRARIEARSVSEGSSLPTEWRLDLQVRPPRTLQPENQCRPADDSSEGTPAPSLSGMAVRRYRPARRRPASHKRLARARFRPHACPTIDDAALMTAGRNY